MENYLHGLTKCEVVVIIVEKEVEVTIGSKNKEHYESLGYEIPRHYDARRNRTSVKRGTKITVLVNDLPCGSHEIIHYICDNCGKKDSITYQNYLRTEHDGLKYCPKCAMSLVTKQVWLDNYGVDHPFKNPEIAQKSKETMIKKYGVENAFSSETIKEKIKQTHLSKLGVEYPMQSDVVKEKSKQTCIEKYGTPYPLQSKEIQQKVINTLTLNNNVPTSKQQIIIYNMLVEKYGVENVILNYPLSNIVLDVLLKYQNELFDVEYDCYHWHKTKQEHDRKRDEFSKSLGYKILRIKSSHSIPNINCIVDKIEKMIQNDYKYSEIVMDDWG